MIFIIQQCVHYWGASTAQPGGLQFSNSEQVFMKKNNGHFKNIRICNGKHWQTLAELGGVLVVQCAQSNGNGGNKPPPPGITYNITAEIPIPTSGCDKGDRNGGITTLVEIETGHSDPNAAIETTNSSIFVAVTGIGQSSINYLS